MTRPNPYLTVPPEIARRQADLHTRTRQLVWQLQAVETALDLGVPWNEMHASEWREAQRVADRIKDKYGDLSQEDDA